MCDPALGTARPEDAVAEPDDWAEESPPKEKKKKKKKKPRDPIRSPNQKAGGMSKGSTRADAGAPMLRGQF